MSYCRFSNDDFQCDVYCYEADDGFNIHVAATRPVLHDGDLPSYVPYSPERADEWMGRHEKVMAWVEAAEHRPIGLPYDGTSFTEATATDAAGRLQMLKDTGYNVPRYAIDALSEEGREADGEKE